MLLRSIRPLLCAALVSLVTLVGWTGPASAHTGFKSSDPKDGAVVAAPVETMTLVFSGIAEPTGTGFQILDPLGQLRAPSEVSSVDNLTWLLRFDPPLVGGTVGVRWMVKGPDSHPIEGSFTFSVAVADQAPGGSGQPVGQSGEPDVAAGHQPGQTQQAEGVPTGAESLDSFLDSGSGTSTAPNRIGAIARMIALVGTLAGVGGLAFAAAVLDGHYSDTGFVLHWVRRAGVLVVAGTAAELMTQISIESGGAWTLSAIGAVTVSNFGVSVILRIGGGLILASGAHPKIPVSSATLESQVVENRLRVHAAQAPQSRSSQAETPSYGRSVWNMEPFRQQGIHGEVSPGYSTGAIVGVVALLAAHLFDGHTVTKGNRLLTSIIDMVHVAGGAVWVGGVLMLAAVLWRRNRQQRDPNALALAVRFSVLASRSLVAVGVAGLALVVVVIDGPSDLWSTQWGLTLLAKMVFVGLAGAAGGYNHKVLIPRMQQAANDPLLAQHFVAIVTGEAAVLLAAVVATALLMGASL